MKAVMDKNIKTLLINLDRSPDRLVNATKNLQAHGIAFERIAAVDGNRLSEEQLAQLTEQDAISGKTWITPQVVGCSLSHREAYKRIIDSNCDWGLVLEDDIEFTLHTEEIINKSIEHINTTDIFLLYFHGKKKTFSKTGKIYIDSVVSFYPAASLEGGYSTGAYLLHRETAKKLYDYVFPVHISADSYHNFYNSGVIGGLWALLPPITRPSNFGSDITYSRIGKWMRQLELSGMPIVNSIPQLLRRLVKTTKSDYTITEIAPAWMQNSNKELL